MNKSNRLDLSQTKGSCPCLPNAFEVEKNIKCTLCHESCRYCVGAKENGCVACYPNSKKPYLMPEKNSEFAIERGYCVNYCDPGYYLEIKNFNEMICRRCNEKCKTCAGPREIQCKSCYSTNPYQRYF